MPISNPWHMATVLHYARAVKPVRILDIGVGMGAYGFMLRQFLDVINENVSKNTWEKCVEGIEIFEAYQNPVWDYVYDKVHMGDVRKILPTLASYDLVICADVLEHFPIDEARLLIQSILEKAPVLIATTPAGYYPQGAWGGNEAETHHCTLTASDFPYLIAHEKTVETACYVCATSGEAIKRIKIAHLTCPKVKNSRLKLLAARLLVKFFGSK